MSFKNIIKETFIFKAVERYLRQRYTGFPDGERYPRGHYYSPLPDISEISSMEDSLFLKNEDSCLCIDLQEKEQLSLLKKLSVYYSNFNYSEKPDPKCRFHLGQEWFCHGDALILYAMMRHLRPKNVIEAGSGFSSALMLDTDQKFSDKRTKFTFIEPYPDRLLALIQPEDRNHCRIIQEKLQDMDLAMFRELQCNDILFIDSSHVSKFGSDVNFVLFEVLPILQPGVVIHFHDIMWPFEYPKQWILMGRAWNEAYILRAFLQYNNAFRILLFNSFAGYHFKKYFEENMPLFLKNTGGSIWLQKVSNGTPFESKVHVRKD